MTERRGPGGARGLERRELLKLGAAGAAGLLAQRLAALEPGPAPSQAKGPHNPVTAAAMPTRNLGRTGFQVGL